MDHLGCVLKADLGSLADGFHEGCESQYQLLWFWTSSWVNSGLSLRWTRWGGGGCDWGRSSLELRQCRISGVNTSC